MIREYLLQNWTLILVLTAFAVLLKTTVFLNKKSSRRMYILIATVFLLSIIVFTEFYLDDLGEQKDLRVVLMAIRYSATPFTVAMILFTLAKNRRLYVFLPAIALAVFNFISIFNGIVFSLDESGELHRGPLGYLPYIAVGLYCFYLVYILIKQSNKLATEIIPIIFLCFAFISGMVLPFVLGKDYSKLFCSTIAVALFVYYDFSILQMTKKDSLTGLLNRQAFNAAVGEYAKTATAVVAIDMNGLKKINDTQGHTAGDEALETLALCFKDASKAKQLVYRMGGDEFVIVCRNTSESEVKSLVERIQKNVAETPYSCSVGYSYSPDGSKTVDEMIKESDEMMYVQKKQFYQASGGGRHRA